MIFIVIFVFSTMNIFCFGKKNKIKYLFENSILEDFEVKNKGYFKS